MAPETTDCVQGATNTAKIEGLEKETGQICTKIDALSQKLDKAISTIHDKINTSVNGLKDKMIELAGKPGWVVVFLMSGLSSLCTGLIIWIATH